MSDVRQILQAIDSLSVDELETVYRHVVQRRHPSYWLVPGEQLRTLEEIMRPVHEEAASMTDEEINAVIDEAIEEVRRERHEKTDRGD